MDLKFQKEVGRPLEILKRYGYWTPNRPNEMMEYVCKNNRSDLAKWLHRKFNITRESLVDKRKSEHIARAAARNGALEALKWLHETYEFTKKEMLCDDRGSLKIAAQRGHVETVRWICETFKARRSEILTEFSLACAVGQLEVAKYFKQTYKLKTKDAQINDNYALKQACKNGHFKMVKWMHENLKPGFTINDIETSNYFAYHWAHNGDHSEIVDWIEQNFNIDPKIKALYEDSEDEEEQI